jgi:hypothetical protein
VVGRGALWGALIAAWTLALALGPVTAASAQTHTSQITAPATTTFPLDDATLSEGGAKIAVEGTTTASAATKLDIGCYGGEEAEEVAMLAEEVSVKSHKFSAEIARSTLPAYLCTLRAVPSEEAEELEEPALAQDFKGPLVATSSFALSSSAGYEASSDALAGEFEFEGAEACGMESFLYSPTSLLIGEELFSCAAYVEDRWEAPGEALRVDGAYGYGPLAAAAVEEAIAPQAPLGVPKATVTKSFDEATGAIAIHEEDPIVKCEPESLPTPTKASCTSFASTGVSLRRTWETSAGGQVARLTDQWSSTDGDAHALSFRYTVGLSSAEEGGRYELPGSSEFVATQSGESVTLPPGADTILYKSSAGEPEDETAGRLPQGAIVYDSAPSEPLGMVLGSEEPGASEFELPYQRTIPAGGAATVRMTFIQTFAMPEARELATEALESYYPGDRPQVAIAAPASGATIAGESPTVAVSGSATDAIALSSFTVDGHEVSVAADGTWTTSVALVAGMNTITAAATNQTGATDSSSVTVDYVPTAPAAGGGTTGTTTGTTGTTGAATSGGGSGTTASTNGSGTPASTVPGAHATQVGSLSSARGEAALTLFCPETAATSCTVQLTLSTTEIKRDGRLVGVSAAERSTTPLAVGTARATIPAGHQSRIAIALNALGRRLLARFGRLPVRLTASQVQSSGEVRILSRTLTLTRPSAKHLTH